MPPARPSRSLRFPSRFKPWAVPVWNAGVHSARWLADHAGAILHGRAERCAACGLVGLMVYRRRVIPPELARRWGLTERLARAVARKESLECSRCGVKLRGRRLARALLDLAPAGPARSLAEWARRPEVAGLRIAEVNRIEGVHDALAAHPGFEPSDYLDGAAPGAVVAGVRHEDLTRLTYPDAAFDLVLTSETLEHVPDLGRALAEVRRVLKLGGAHVFTVPLLPGVPATYPRATLDPDGTTRHHAKPIAHPGGDRGWPVFTEFGADLPDLLRRAGFAVEVRFGPTTEDDVAQVYVARRADPPS